jgi:BASS family bile acid:Na+ symporter
MTASGAAALSWPLRILAAIGRHGAIGFAASIFLGLALPGLANTMRPVLPVTIFCFVTLAFARANLGGVRRVMSRPLPFLGALAWITFGLPLLIEIGLAVVGRDAVGPGLLLGLALVAAAPPLMGFPVYAALLGLDNSLGMALLVVTMAVTPLLAPPLAGFIAGEAVPLDPMTLGLRLFLLLGGSLVGCLVVRRVVGVQRLAARKSVFDGINVVIYFIFAIAAMDGVIDAARATPGKVAGFLAVSFALAGTGFAAAQLVMRWLGRSEAFVLGLGTGMRNSGLLVAALGAACPPDTYLFFSLLQIPIYCAPLLVSPLARIMVPASARTPA